jgi:hypothetical protein
MRRYELTPNPIGSEIGFRLRKCFCRIFCAEAARGVEQQDLWRDIHTQKLSTNWLAKIIDEHASSP